MRYTRSYGTGLALAALLLLAAGCRSYTDVKVVSDPPGAQVILDGQGKGDTPTMVRLPHDNRTHYLILEKQGYQRATKMYERVEHYPEHESELKIPLSPKPAK